MEVSYKPAGFRERVFAFAFDLMLMLISLLFLMWGTHSITINTPFYKNANQKINDLEMSTHLYALRSDGNAQLLCDYYKLDDETKYEEYAIMFDQALTDFYSDPQFFENLDAENGLRIYWNLKIPPENPTNSLFIYTDETHTQIVKKEDTTFKQYYDFCVDVMTNEAIKHVVNNDVYIKNSRTISLSFIFIDLLIPIVLTSLIYQLIIPLCISRGKKTLGKLIFKISVVDSRGLSCSWKRYLARYGFLLGVETILSLVAFLIPIIVSFTMFVRSKIGQCFHDYVCNTFVVDAPLKSVCKTKEEYLEKYKKEKDFNLSKDDVAY